MQEELLEFLTHLRFERARSVNTVEGYERDLNRYLLFMVEQGIESPSTIRRAHIISHIQQLRELGLAPRSLARAISAIRHYHRFLVREGLADMDPAVGLPSPALPQGLPEYMTVEQAKKLVEAPAVDTPLGVRDRAMMEVLWACGLRVSELAGLTIDHCYWDEGIIKVFGKGSKERLVPIHATAIYWTADRYLARGNRAALKGKRSIDEGKLFLSIRGRPLTRDALFKIVKKYAEQAELQVHVSPHIFRHTFATHLINDGADIRAVQEMLGHADISSTQIYTHVERDYLKKVHEQCHPRARKQDRQ